MTEIKNILPIPFCEKLEKLNLIDTNYKDISFLKYNKNIIELKLGYQKFSEDFISKFEKLEVLHFTYVDNISFLAKLKNIKELEFYSD